MSSLFKKKKKAIWNFSWHHSGRYSFYVLTLHLDPTTCDAPKFSRYKLFTHWYQNRCRKAISKYHCFCEAVTSKEVPLEVMLASAASLCFSLGQSNLCGYGCSQSSEGKNLMLQVNLSMQCCKLMQNNASIGNETGQTKTCVFSEEKPQNHSFQNILSYFFVLLQA